VMDVHNGGSLISCAMTHWNKFGNIPETSISKLAKQMMMSIAWLHQNGVVHRDVKGDNYVMDEPSLTSTKCRIYLCDFGNAVVIAPGQRLTSSAGTTRFWAPELYLRRYGLKVDVWAAGVITYGLFNRTFPFRDEKDVRDRAPSWKVHVSVDAKHFIDQVLNKIESERASAADALKHRWIVSNVIGDELSHGVHRLDVEPSGIRQVRRNNVLMGRLRHCGSVKSACLRTGLYRHHSTWPQHASANCGSVKSACLRTGLDRHHSTWPQYVSANAFP